MNFPVLPAYLNRADNPSFARAPIGSGPYQLQPKRESGSVDFVANPYYERRSGKSGLPRIREIHFVCSENPVNDFKDGKIQLLLDLPTSRYKELDSAGLGVGTLKTLPNRRIYFLAVNYRRPPLDNKELRLAIAHAINREDILTKHFRGGLMPRPPHKALNGPYPPRSWAWDSTLPTDPYKPNLAKAHAEKAKEGRAVLRKLSLKYPKDDPAVAQACEEIRNQVRQLGAGIDLELKPLEPRDLRRDVEEQHDYDLAYYSWDYPDETYWLLPLLGQGGRNFLGYQDDSELEGAILQAMIYRNPARVKSLTHRIHEIFYEKMPFIPLWQLDTHLAIHQSLSMVDSQDRPVDPDPLLIFTSVETWKLDKQ
jgi:peptide/nickel transport system substrate-binding protein